MTRWHNSLLTTFAHVTRNTIPIAPARVDSSKGPHQANRAHWPTKENRQTFVMFLIFSAYVKNGLRWPQIGPGGFFPSNPDLADILGKADLDFEIFYFSAFLGSQISGFPSPQIVKFPDRGLGQLGPARALLRGGPAALPDHKGLRSKELGQYRENPISASPVWGMLKLDK